MPLDRETVRTIHTEMDAALAAVGKKYNMVIRTGRVTYDPTEGSFRASLTALKVNAAEVTDKRLSSVKPKDIANAKARGCFGKTVSYGGKDYEIVGHNGYVLLGWDPRKQSGVRFDQRQTAQVMPQLIARPAASLTITPMPSTPTLAKYIEYISLRNKAFGESPLDINNLTDADKVKLADHIASELSPENLSFDGEASRTHIISRGNFLRAAAAELVSIGGPAASY